jgi:hypothetical protein
MADRSLITFMTPDHLYDPAAPGGAMHGVLCPQLVRHARTAKQSNLACVSAHLPASQSLQLPPLCCGTGHPCHASQLVNCLQVPMSLCPPQRESTPARPADAPVRALAVPI